MSKQEFQNIIFRYFRGQLTENEYEQLTDYLQESENRKIFEKTKTEWTLNPEMDEASRKNWNRLEYKINSANTNAISIPGIRRLWFQIIAVAAILAIGLFIGSISTFILSTKDANPEDLVFETARGQKSMVTLPDGSQVWLNAKSRLVYHSFSTKNRNVELTGEAFFKVAHNENAAFVVKTDKCEVEVLGTKFNVMAYNEFGRQEITLLTGKVNVHTRSLDDVILPGQALIIKDTLTHIVKANGSQATGWVENKFNFQNIPLSELMKRLENWYDVDITLDNKTSKEVNFTGTFKNEETIWQVLEAIKVYTPIEYKKTDLRKIKITIR